MLPERKLECQDKAGVNTQGRCSTQAGCVKQHRYPALQHLDYQAYNIYCLNNVTDINPVLQYGKGCTVRM